MSLILFTASLLSYCLAIISRDNGKEVRKISGEVIKLKPEEDKNKEFWLLVVIGTVFLFTSLFFM